MAAPSAQVDPTGILEDAVADFRSALTPEEQIRLDDECGGGLPDSNAAFTFTASLDRINASKRRGQSLASRLFSLIQSVQQFTNIIDTYVSANPEISALVWSSVKLTFLVIANLVSYFEAFSKLFLRFEAMRPRFEEYSLLFPSSVRLQTSMFRFHASIIKCCKEAIVISRRPWQNQLFNVFFSSFQTEMTPFIEDIELKAKEVKSEISLAKAQADRDEHLLQDQERREASRHRLQVTRLLSKRSGLGIIRPLAADDPRKEIEYLRSNRRKRELLDELSKYNHMAAFRQGRRRRFLNTGQWVCRAPEFLDWERSAVSSTLILSGKIGSGKTILSTAILDHLFHDCDSATSIMFYHVCFDNTESLQSDTLMRSLICQNLAPESLSKRVYKLLVTAKQSMFSSESLYTLLEQRMRESRETYIVIDGLDELATTEEKLVINMLKRLLKDSEIVLKLFVSTRDSRAKDFKKTFIGSHHISLQGERQKEDMKSYITQVVEERIETGDLVVEDDILVSEIQNALVDGAQGMFLWVALEIEELCFQRSDAAIRAVLDDLPKDLIETFNRALRRILTRGRNSKEVVKRILQIVAATARPLTLAELAEAASVEVGQKFWKRGQRLNNMIAVPSWCESLMAVDEESQVVQFIHHTVKKFIFQLPSTSSTSKPTADPELDQFHFSFEQANHSLGEICVTYLGLGDFKTTIVKRDEPLPVFDPKATATMALKSNWNTCVADALASVVSPRKQLSATASGTSRSESVARLGLLRANRSQPLHETHKEAWAFLGYASNYWLNHTTTFSALCSQTDPYCWGLFLGMIPGTHHIATAPWKVQEFEDPFPVKVIRWADRHLHIALLRHLLMETSLSPLTHPNWNFGERLGLLSSRAEYMVKGGLLSEFQDRFPLTHASFVALYGGALAARATSAFPLQSIGPLLDEAPPCDCRSSLDNPLNGDLCNAISLGVPDEDAFARLTLLVAAWHGNTATIEAYGGLPDSPFKVVDGKTAMHLAAEVGHMRMVRELLAIQEAERLNVATRGTRETPYHLAIKNNHHVLARYILSKGGRNGRQWGVSREDGGTGGRWGSDCAERGDSDSEKEMGINV